jgi:hypothetical protein
MIHQISPGTIGIRCMVFATAVAAFCILSASSANAQSTTWTVTVIATGSDAKPEYKVSPTSGGCPNQTTQNPKKLHVCAGDTVQWIASTTKTQNDMYLFQEESILLDPSGVPTQGFYIQDTAPVGGKITSDASLVGWHEYYIGVWDKNAKRLYVDDPKIIIGTGPPLELLDEVRKDCGKFARSFSDETKANEAQTICRDVEQKLKKLLAPK